LKIKTELHGVNKTLVVDICDNILYSSQHLSATIDDFRDFYKVNKEAKESTYDEILSGVLSIIKVPIENKGIKLEFDLLCHEKLITFPNEIKQVVMNLLKNAEDALLAKDIKDPTIYIRTYKDGYKYVLEIEDNAGGIDESIIDKIFDPYFSTKTKKDGTGLGLYMSKMIIEDHCKGSLSVFNTQNGACFKIELKEKL